ncbi:MAG: DNA polymerase III subunit alpha [Methylocystis sp.]|uniref:DNA polymerase III subunit alpha n=1 Tax=Methylocystis sp. TaxID=1911079 RepID=UPI003DA55097
MPAAEAGFLHLHVHTAYSLREGALSLGKLIDLAVRDLQPALAVTDTNNLFAALEFSEKAVKAGLQPIAGAQLRVDFGDGKGGAVAARDDRFANIVLLAKTEAGYRNLMRLASRAFLDVEQGDEPHLTLDALAADAEELIALTGGPDGALDRALAQGRPEQARARLATLERLYGDRLYIEVQRHSLRSERDVEPQLLDLAYRRGLPLVATNEPYFAQPADFEAHDALLCIAEGAVTSVDDRRRVSPEHYFKTRAQICALFADLQEATANTLEIARRVSFRPQTRKPIMPRFVQEARDAQSLDEIEAQELRRQAIEGLEQRLAAHGPAPGRTREEYAARLDFELSVIEKMRFPGYFLIVSDFIKFAKSQGIPVGPGRGSGAGSLVAYALTITDLDPVRFGLFFERFLNPERNSMPDFDIDFCQTRRGEVIDYVRRRYGTDRVAQIITFGSFLARGVLRSVGRVLEMPLGQVDKLAKLVPQNPAKPVTLAEALASEQKLREAVEEDERVRRLFKIAGSLEGLFSNASTHAAGVVIGDRPLHEVTPLYRDPKSDMPATQFNMKWVEPAGLIKFDFLGLKTLTVLATASGLARRRDPGFDLAKVPLDDPATYALLGRGETVGIFQLESAGMRKALVEMHADRFEDIIALVALYRPGPMANIPTYCAVKLGDEEADYYHPKIEPILKETFGVIIYQEQVMQIAQVLSGYTLGEADMLRRAMGKKIKSEMDAQRERFVKGAIAGEVKADLANFIFDLLAKFADYGFNKSHAAAYALIAYQTAWFKTHYPAEFLAASMTFDKSQTDKLAEFRDEARRMGIAVEPPSINESGVDFDVAPGAEGRLAIRYAFSAIKGVGEAQAESLVRSRGARQFASLADVARRLNPREVNKKTLESLTACGAFDQIEPNRARAFAAIEAMLAAANRHAEDRKAGQNALFGEAEAADLAVPKTPPWPAAETLRREYEAAGFFLSGHPLDAYAGLLPKIRVSRWSEFAASVKRGATAGRLAAVVLDRTERRTKSGSKMGILQLSDVSGHYEAILFQEGLTQYRDLLEKGAAVLVTLSAAVEGEDVRARIVAVEPLAAAAARAQKGLRVVVGDEGPLDGIKTRLAGRGDGEVSILLKRDAGREEIEIRLPGSYPITPEVAGALRAIPGVLEVEYL